MWEKHKSFTPWKYSANIPVNILDKNEKKFECVTPYYYKEIGAANLNQVIVNPYGQGGKANVMGEGTMENHQGTTYLVQIQRRGRYEKCFIFNNYDDYLYK